MDRFAPRIDIIRYDQGDRGHAEPCRACGASQDDGVEILFAYPDISYRVRCRACGALGPESWKDEPADHEGAVMRAIAAWNAFGGRVRSP